MPLILLGAVVLMLFLWFATSTVKGATRGVDSATAGLKRLDAWLQKKQAEQAAKRR